MDKNTPLVVITPVGDRFETQIDLRHPHLRKFAGAMGSNGILGDPRAFEFGLIACDLVRHAALALGVHEDMIWQHVDRERELDTGELSGEVR